MKAFLSITAFFALLSCNTTESNSAKETANRLTGTWKYVADDLLDSNNNVIKEDTAVDGLLIYTPEGKVSVQFLWKGTRAPIMNDTIMNNNGLSNSLGLGVNSWSQEEARKLIDTYEAYYGDYTVNWETNVVIHILSGNLRPEKAGTVYKRYFNIRGDSLYLKSTDPAERWGAACVRVKKNNSTNQ